MMNKKEIQCLIKKRKVTMKRSTLKTKKPKSESRMNEVTFL